MAVSSPEALLNVGVSDRGHVRFLSFRAVAHGQGTFLVQTEQSRVSLFKGCMLRWNSRRVTRSVHVWLIDFNSERSRICLSPNWLSLLLSLMAEKCHSIMRFLAFSHAGEDHVGRILFLNSATSALHHAHLVLPLNINVLKHLRLVLVALVGVVRVGLAIACVLLFEAGDHIMVDLGCLFATIVRFFGSGNIAHIHRAVSVLRGRHRHPGRHLFFTGRSRLRAGRVRLVTENVESCILNRLPR